MLGARQLDENYSVATIHRGLYPACGSNITSEGAVFKDGLDFSRMVEQMSVVRKEVAGSIWSQMN